MYYYRYSITLPYWLPLVVPSVMYLAYTPMQSNHRVHTTSKNLEIPKGRTILSWGRLYHVKPKTTKIQTIDNTMLHTPVQTIVYTNGTYFCFIHNHYKHKYHLYVLKLYISIHMYYAIEYTIVIYNRLLQLRYICYIHNPLYV